MVNDVLAIVVMGRLELHRHYMVLLRHILPVSNNPSRACFLPSPLNSALVCTKVSVCSLPTSGCANFMAIDEAYADWYLARHGVKLDRSYVLPVLHALQGHRYLEIFSISSFIE